MSEARTGEARFERLLRVYRRRIGRCRTGNEINRVHIALTDYLTPAEFRRFAAVLAQQPEGSPGRHWAESLTAMLPARMERAQAFERVGLANGCSLYTDPAVPRARKRLIIGFAGNSRRLMLPPALLLDCLDPAAYDLAVLRDYRKAFYVAGIPGLGASFTELLPALASRLDPNGYGGTIALGTSGGAVPAVLAAVGLPLDRAIAIGAMRFEEFDAVRAARGAQEAPLRALLASRPEPYPDVTFVFGAEHAGDADRARSLGHLFPSRLRAVRGCPKHGVLGWALERGVLPAVLTGILEEAVGRPSPAGRVAGPC